MPRGKPKKGSATIDPIDRLYTIQHKFVFLTDVLSSCRLNEVVDSSQSGLYFIMKDMCDSLEKSIDDVRKLV